MDQVKSNFYENQILGAIETVANGIVSKLKFDQTILCTITNDKKKKKGIYEVTDGTSTFEACADDDSYTKDTVVYVLVPQGDYENQKTIIGKYVDDTSSAINYISMMDSFISVKDSSNSNEYSLIANHPKKKFIDIPIDVSHLAETNQYNCVGIQADFRTDLSQENIIAGNYGLILTLYGEDASTGKSIAPKSYGLDCSEMYGDPYNYNFYFTQSMVFDLAKDFANTRITNATISFYQNENFKILDNEALSYNYSTTYTYIDENGNEQKEESPKKDKQPNLFVKNVVLKFGYNLSDITEEGIRLYSLNDTKYVNRTNEKNISLKWFVKNEVEERLPYLIIDNKEEAEDEKNKILTGDYSIYWYRYVIDNSAEDPLAGVYWNIIPEGIYNDKVFVENKESEKNELTYVLEENPEGKYAKVNDAENGALILATDKNAIKYDIKIYPGKRYNDTSSDVLEEPFEYTFGPNELLSREKIKAILVRNEWREVLTEGKDDDDNIYVHFEDASKYYESNELVYENANPASQNLASVDLIRNMRLECQDGKNGIYKLYNGVDNVIIGNEDTRDRTLNVIFDTYSTIDIPSDEEKCSIKWKIPKNNSMIHTVDFSIDDTDKISIPNDQEKNIVWKTEGNYYICSYNWVSNIAGTDNHHEGAILPIHYRINDYYAQSYSNNTIICEITKYGRVYMAEIEFIFGETGTNGTGYTLNLRLEKEYDSDGNSLTTIPVPCLTANPNNKVKVIATLFDEHGNDITDGKTIAWSWRGSASGFDYIDNKNGSCYVWYTKEKSISECYGILRATVASIWNGNTTLLTGYLPLSIRAVTGSMSFYNGTTKVIYDAQGGKPVFQAEHSLDTETTLWQVKVLDDNGYIENEGTENEKQYPPGWFEYAPYFKEETDETGAWNLIARDMYFTDLSTKQIVIQAFNGSNVIYSQSLLYDQNRFGNAMFNDWDGSLVVDEVGNKILSAIVGAGKKNGDNTFTGVIMGDTTANSGLIGYSKGVQTFGFDTNGTAFIGASGKGRIEFNGTTGTISSAQGDTYFDLSNGKIHLSNENNEEATAEIILDSSPDIGNYFTIKHKSGTDRKNLIVIGKNSYYLRSKDFANPDDDNEGTGVEFNLYNGKLTGYNFLIQAGQGNNKLIINSDIKSKPLTIGSNFSVAWDGTMKAINGEFSGTISAATGTFSGTITASEGNIAGWILNKNGLHNGGFNSDGTQYNTKKGYAVFSPGGTNLAGTKFTEKDESLSDIVFNIGTQFAIDSDGKIYAKSADLGGDYTTSTEFSSLNITLSGQISDINTLIGNMNNSYGSIIKIDGDLGSTATFLAKGDDVSGYKGEGYYNSNDQKFYSNYNKENNTYSELISAEDGYIYYDILTSQMYLYKNNQYSVYNAKFFNVSTEGLLTANNAVISGTIYATNGWFGGGISASEGYFGNWEILNTGELKGTPSDSDAGYNIILNPNYTKDISSTRRFYYTHTWAGSEGSDTTEENDNSITDNTVNRATISFDIKANDSLETMQNNFVDAVNTEDSSFEWGDLTAIQKLVLNMQFIFFRSTLIDNNIFKIKNISNKTIFGIDGNGFLNWRFYDTDTFNDEKNRFIIQAETDGTNQSLNVGWLDWNKSTGNQAAWSFTSDGNLNLSKLKSTSYHDTYGGFQLYGEDASDKFWNNSLFTTNKLSSDNINYVGFLRAVGSSSQSLSNVFIGCKQYSKTSWPTNNDWSNNANYNFYIRFDGKAKFETFHTKKYDSDKFAIRPNETTSQRGTTRRYFLGSENFPWNKIYVNEIETKSTYLTITGTLDTKGHILPYTNETYNLGNSSYYWNNLYVNKIHLPENNTLEFVSNDEGDYISTESLLRASDIYLTWFTEYEEDIEVASNWVAECIIDLYERVQKLEKTIK